MFLRLNFDGLMQFQQIFERSVFNHFSCLTKVAYFTILKIIKDKLFERRVWKKKRKRVWKILRGKDVCLRVPCHHVRL